jgi:cell division protein FtsI (penicillin-binding protein 3)
VNKSNSKILWKVGLIYGLIIIAIIIIIVRIFVLHSYKPIKDNSLQVIIPKRGSIYSSDKKILAISIPYYEIQLSPHHATEKYKKNFGKETEKFKSYEDSVLFFKRVDSLAVFINEIFPQKTYQKYKSDLERGIINKSKYYLLNSKASQSQFAKIQDYCKKRDFLKGKFVLSAKTKYERNYPFENLGKRTIGTTNEIQTTVSDSVLDDFYTFNIKKIKGEAGLEGYFDSLLGGNPGIDFFERISKESWKPLKESKDGADLYSSINIFMQEIIDYELEKQLINTDAEWGTAVLMEVETGKVRAISNLEKITKRDPITKKIIKNKNDSIEYIYSETVNFAAGNASNRKQNSRFPDPGSTFKLASVIVALEDSVVTPETIINTENGEYQFFSDSKKVVDTKKGGYGKITVQQAFEYSSNVGITKMIYSNYRTQRNKFIEGLYKLKLNEPIGIMIPGERSPKIKNVGDASWTAGSFVQIAYGYELENMSPLRLLTLYNAIANNGKMVKPIFADSIVQNKKTTQIFNAEIISAEICSQKTIKSVQKMLEGVVERGTAHRYKSENVKFAGKTGTAQIDYAQLKDKKEMGYYCSFVGYFPVEKPKYSIFVGVYRPRKHGNEGSTVALPIFKRIIDKIISTSPEFYQKINNYNSINIIPTAKKGNFFEINNIYQKFNLLPKHTNFPSSEWVTTKIINDSVVYQEFEISSKSIVPNVCGMCLKDAIPILEERGLKVKIKGKGTVKKQSIKQGAKFTKGTTIILNLSI